MSEKKKLIIKIRTKLNLILTLLTALIIAIIVNNFFTFESLSGDATSINLAGSERMRSFKLSYLANLYISEKDFVKKEAAKETIKAEIVTFDNILKGLVNGDKDLKLVKTEDKESLNKISSIKTKWEEMRQSYNNISSSKDDNSIDIKFVNDNIADLVKEINDLVTHLDVVSTDKVSMSKNISILILIISIFIVFLSFIMIRKSILKPIDNIKNRMKDIADGDGDLTSRININSRDEIGELASLFNSFVSNIHKIVTNVIHTAESSKDTSKQIAQISFQSGQATEIIASSAQEVAEGSEVQTREIEDLFKKVEVMTGKISDINYIVKMVVGSSKTSQNEAQNGNVKIEETKFQLENLKLTINEMNSKMDLLDHNSNEISKIVELINNISSQTNLLALNASIEAARAGEMGRGFAIVANEVKKLSVETEYATKKILPFIKEVQSSVGSVKSYMNEVISELDKEFEVLDETIKVLHIILEGSKDTVLGVNNTSDILVELNTNFNDIKSVFLNIKNVTKHNSLNMQNVAASVEEQAASTEEISASIDSLSSMVLDLHDVVSGFKV